MTGIKPSGTTICLAALLAAYSTRAAAQTLVNLGTTVRVIKTETERLTLADIPMLEATVGGGGGRHRQFYVSLNTGLTWGVQGRHSVDVYFGDTFRWYPVRNVGLFAQGRVGTSVLGSVGADVEIPMPRDARLVIGVEYFNRLARKHGSGDGLGIRIALGFRPNGGGP